MLLTNRGDTTLEFTEPPDVRGFLHRPEGLAGDGVVLTHGAGSSCNAPLIVSVASGLAGAGLTVLRCDLPFRQARPHGPPVGPVAARDRAGLKRAVAAMRKLIPGRVFLGGHSYGGRQASILCAEEPDLVDGLLLLSYPLHPPRKPDELRTAHLPQLQTRALFIHGSRDPFGTPEEMQAAVALIPVETKLVLIDGAAHDLGRTQVTGEIVAAFGSFFVRSSYEQTGSVGAT